MITTNFKSLSDGGTILQFEGSSLSCGNVPIDCVESLEEIIEKQSKKSENDIKTLHTNFEKTVARIREGFESRDKRHFAFADKQYKLNKFFTMFIALFSILLIAVYVGLLYVLYCL